MRTFIVAIMAGTLLVALTLLATGRISAVDFAGVLATLGVLQVPTVKLLESK